MPPTEQVAKEMLEGRVHYSAVEWAAMPKYQQVIMIGDINAKIPIINVSSNTILCDVAKAIKESLQK